MQNSSMGGMTMLVHLVHKGDVIPAGAVMITRIQGMGRLPTSPLPRNKVELK